jgi:hypothetical protein
MRKELAPDHKAFLEGRFAAWAKEQPAAVNLRKQLLNVGGLEVVAPPNNFEQDLDLILSQGKVFSGEVQCRIMADNSCHQNVAQLYRASTDERFGIGTGFALNNCLWRQHSWAMDGNAIVETTEEREIYFGIILQKAATEYFCASVLE